MASCTMTHSAGLFPTASAQWSTRTFESKTKSKTSTLESNAQTKARTARDGCTSTGIRRPKTRRPAAVLCARLPPADNDDAAPSCHYLTCATDSPEAVAASTAIKAGLLTAASTLRETIEMRASQATSARDQSDPALPAVWMAEVERESQMAASSTSNSTPAATSPASRAAIAAVKIRRGGSVKEKDKLDEAEADEDATARDEQRWRLVSQRSDAAATDPFVYGVKTTRIFCRPTCHARLARRANVRFFTCSADALAAGFRPCKRCRPEAPSAAGTQLDAQVRAVRRALTLLRAQDGHIPVAMLADRVGLSHRYFYEAFKRVTGVSPGAYARALRDGITPSASTAGPSTPNGSVSAAPAAPLAIFAAPDPEAGADAAASEGDLGRLMQGEPGGPEQFNQMDVLAWENIIPDLLDLGPDMLTVHNNNNSNNNNISSGNNNSTLPESSSSTNLLATGSGNAAANRGLLDREKHRDEALWEWLRGGCEGDWPEILPLPTADTQEREQDPLTEFTNIDAYAAGIPTLATTAAASATANSNGLVDPGMQQLLCEPPYLYDYNRPHEGDPIYDYGSSKFEHLVPLPLPLPLPLPFPQGLAQQQQHHHHPQQEEQAALLFQRPQEALEVLLGQDQPQPMETEDHQ